MDIENDPPRPPWPPSPPAPASSLATASARASSPWAAAGEQEFLLLGPMEEPGKKDRRPASIEGYLRDIASQCGREELKRLFYVAATRARKRLYLSAAVAEGRQPDANSMLRLLWDVPGMQQEFAVPPLELRVDQHRRLHGIPIMQIVRGVLKVPA